MILSYIFTVREIYIPFYRERYNMSFIDKGFTIASLFYFYRKGLIMKENKFQSDLIKEIKKKFCGCIVMKNDSGHIQGIPDITVLYKDRWAALECKKNKGASKRPNQSYYIDKMNEMSFARFIFPENKEEILNELEQTFSAGR